MIRRECSDAHRLPSLLTSKSRPRRCRECPPLSLRLLREAGSGGVERIITSFGATVLPLAVAVLWLTERAVIRRNGLS